MIESKSVIKMALQLELATPTHNFIIQEVLAAIPCTGIWPVICAASPYFVSWERYSGDTLYPISDPDGGCPVKYYYKLKDVTEDAAVYKASCLSLCNHIISEIAKEEKESRLRQVLLRELNSEFFRLKKGPRTVLSAICRSFSPHSPKAFLDELLEGDGGVYASFNREIADDNSPVWLSPLRKYGLYRYRLYRQILSCLNYEGVRKPSIFDHFRSYKI